MKITVVFIFSLIFINFTLGQINNRVEQALQKLVNDPDLSSAAISFQAIDLLNDSIIAAYNPNMALPPASTIKLYTTAAAFETLGPFYRPKTGLYIDGKIDSTGVLQGDLWIKGGGDPTLGSRFFEKEGEERNFLKIWVDTILALGVTEIKGRVIADGSDFGYEGAPEGWTWGDMGNYYGSGPSGCVLFDNMTYLSFHTSSKLNDTTTITCMQPHIEGLRIKNEVKTAKSRYDNAYIYGAPFSYDRFALGSLPFNQTNFKVKASIPDPEFLMAQELQYELGQYIDIEQPPIGVRAFYYDSITTPDYKNKNLIYEHVGKSLNAIVYWTNMKSVNLYAEQLLCLMAYEKYTTGTTSNGVAFSQHFWSPKVGSGLSISDGCGLSRKNASSAAHFTKMLAYMSRSNEFDNFKKTLPVAGKSGTLSRVCRGQVGSGRIFAKSGTMNRIKAYAGYVNSSSGKSIAFAIIVNNHTCSSSVLVKKFERIFNTMATY